MCGSELLSQLQFDGFQEAGRQHVKVKHANNFFSTMYVMRLFELCWLPQRPSLTLNSLGGSTPCMWPLFLLRAKGKRKEMTGTQHVGTLKHQFIQYITIQNVFVLFHYQNNFEINYSSAI
jgi:hypothetical protein